MKIFDKRFGDVVIALELQNFWWSRHWFWAFFKSTSKTIKLFEIRILGVDLLFGKYNYN